MVREQKSKTGSANVYRNNYIYIRNTRFVRVNNAQKLFDARKLFFETIGRLRTRPEFMNYPSNSFRSYKQCTKIIDNFFFFSKRLKNSSSHTNLRILRTSFVCVNNARKSLMHVKLFFFSKRLENFSSEIYPSNWREGGRKGRKEGKKELVSCDDLSLSAERIYFREVKKRKEERN